LTNASYSQGKKKVFSIISLLHSKALIRKLWQCAQHLRAEASGELSALIKKKNCQSFWSIYTPKAQRTHYI